MAARTENSGTTANETPRETLERLARASKATQTRSVGANSEITMSDVKRLERISLQDSLLNLYLPLLIAGFVFGFAATGHFPGYVIWWLTPVLFVAMGLILMAGNQHRQRLHDSSQGDLFHVEGYLLAIYTILLTVMLGLVHFGSLALELSLAEYAGWVVGNDNLGFYHNVERGHPIAQIMMLLRPIAMGLLTGVGFSGLLNATATKSTRLQPRKGLVTNAWLLLLRFLSTGIVALVLLVLGVSFWMGISKISVLGL